jgi:quercetin dioxygenase-like cupin family protein
MTIELVDTPFHTGPDEGPALWHFGALLTFKALSEATGGRLWVKELQAARGMAVPKHVHTHEDEAFYVVDGEISVHVGDDVIGASTGSFLWAPRTVPHAFRIESETAKVLVISTPGSGFDRFFFDTGTPALTRTVPSPDADPPDPDAVMAAARKYGMEILGPPPGPAPR